MLPRHGWRMCRRTLARTRVAWRPDALDPFDSLQNDPPEHNPFEREVHPAADKASHQHDLQMFQLIFKHILQPSAEPNTDMLPGASATMRRIFADAAVSLSQDIPERLSPLMGRIHRALEPALAHMSTLATHTELVEFLGRQVVLVFLERPLRVAAHLGTHLGDAVVAEIAAAAASSPVVNDVTLPVLVNHGLGLLAREFGRYEDTLQLFDRLRSHRELFALCVTPDTYTLMLQVLWVAHRLVTEIEALLVELERHGLGETHATVQTIGKVLADVDAQYANQRDSMFLGDDGRAVDRIAARFPGLSRR